MFYSRLLIVAAILLPASGWSRQDAPALTAKTLYYQGESDDKPPAKAESKQAVGNKAATATKSSTASHDTVAPPVVAKITPAKPAMVGTPVSATVEHLGLRYNLMQFDHKTHKSVAVDPDHMFEEGDCLQLQLSPNRSGYLYVFDQGSSGKWQVLLPSALMSDEMNVVKSRGAIKVPMNYCFTVQNPSGTEHLFVVLSRSQEDMYSLDRAIRSQSSGPATTVAAKSQAESPVTEAANKLDAEIQQMRAGLGSKDLGVEKIGEPDQAGEPADSVYVVNTSNVSSSRLVTEILIRHR